MGTGICFEANLQIQVNKHCPYQFLSITLDTTTKYDDDDDDDDDDENDGKLFLCYVWPTKGV